MNFTTRLPRVFPAGLLGLALLSPAAAAIHTPTAYTDDGSYTITSLTIDGNVYSDLTGSTATLAGANVNAWIQGTSPALGAGDADQAVSGLSRRTGVTNINYGSIFQFGLSIAPTDYIFIGDIGSNDSNLVFKLVDSTGAEIGDYQSTPISFGSAVLPTQTFDGVTDSTGVSNFIGPFAGGVVAFQLSDFTGTTGDVSQATGIKFTGGPNDAWDPLFVGVTAIPEPSSLFLLLGASGVCLALSRRARRR